MRSGPALAAVCASIAREWAFTATLCEIPTDSDAPVFQHWAQARPIAFPSESHARGDDWYRRNLPSHSHPDGSSGGGHSQSSSPDHPHHPGRGLSDDAAHAGLHGEAGAGGPSHHAASPQWSEHALLQLPAPPEHSASHPVVRLAHSHPQTAARGGGRRTAGDAGASSSYARGGQGRAADVGQQELKQQRPPQRAHSDGHWTSSSGSTLGSDGVTRIKRPRNDTTSSSPAPPSGIMTPRPGELSDDADSGQQAPPKRPRVGWWSWMGGKGKGKKS